MKKEKVHAVECYSRAPLADSLELCEGEVNGAHVNSCHPEWRKMCDMNKRCHRFWPFGRNPMKRALARLLDKPVGKLTRRDKTTIARRLEKEAYEECRKICVSVSVA